MGLLIKCFTEHFPFFFSLFFCVFSLLLLPLLFIVEEGGYSSDETKSPIHQDTGLVHLIKLHICREQLLRTWQNGAVATVNSLLGAEKAGD